MALQTNYLLAEEYATFGLPETTTDQQISEASNIVDAYTQRVEGLLWTPDASGLPLCMTRKNAEGARTIIGSIVAGVNVAVQLSPGPVLSVGDSVVLNRLAANAHIAEVCKISVVTDNTHVTLASIAGAHTAAETVETGLLIEEIITLPKNRNVATVGKGPIARVVALLGRVTYSRRGNSSFTEQDMSMYQTISSFGGAPVWQDITFTDSDIDRASNQIWCPSGIMMVPYNEIRINYVAGFLAAALPFQIKQATANIKTALCESPASANIKTMRAGETQMERFLNSVIDDDTARLLAPYVAKSYG